MTRSVLFLAHTYPPENVIGALRPFRFAKYLPNFGYTARVVTASAQPAGTQNIFHVPDRFGPAEKIVNRVLKFQESFAWAQRAAGEAQRLLASAPAELVFSTSPPLGVHIAARMLKHKTGIKWVADFRDPMQGNDVRLAFGIRMVDKFFEPRFFRDANLAIANTAAAAGLLKSRYPQYAEKIRHIYNGFDPETPGLSARALTARPHRWLVHAGSLYRVSMTMPLLETLRKAVETGKIAAGSLRLRMIGEIDEYDRLRTTEAFRALHSAGVLDCEPVRVPVEQARREMAEAEALVVVDRYREGGIIQLPAKAFEYVQIGRPILAVTGAGS